MKLALKELLYNRKKYLLIEAVIVLLMFMVLFLSGLAEGLGLAVRSGIQTIPAEYFLVSDTAENLITVSNLENTVLAQAEAMTDGKVAPLDIQRMYLVKENSDEKLDITYFAIPAGSFLEPEVFEGRDYSRGYCEGFFHWYGIRGGRFCKRPDVWAYIGGLYHNRKLYKAASRVKSKL